MIHRPIPGFPDYYASLNGDIVSGKWPGGRVLQPSPSGKMGYPAVTLRRDGRSHHFTVHVLMALTYLGPRPPGLEVLHADGDGQNCALINLSYGTSGQNKLDQVRHGTHFMASKTHCRNRHEIHAGEYPCRLHDRPACLPDLSPRQLSATHAPTEGAAPLDY